MPLTVDQHGSLWVTDDQTPAADGEPRAAADR
jgi:hypothetical protein